jgi:hypothetical protein
MTGAIGVRTLQSFEDREIQGLSDVLVDCVEGGASVSFMLPIPLAARWGDSRLRAVARWGAVSDDGVLQVAAGLI